MCLVKFMSEDTWVTAGQFDALYDDIMLAWDLLYHRPGVPRPVCGEGVWEAVRPSYECAIPVGSCYLCGRLC